MKWQMKYLYTCFLETLFFFSLTAAIATHHLIGESEYGTISQTDGIDNKYSEIMNELLHSALSLGIKISKSSDSFLFPLKFWIE